MDMYREFYPPREDEFAQTDQLSPCKLGPSPTQWAISYAKSCVASVFESMVDTDNFDIVFKHIEYSV